MRVLKWMIDRIENQVQGQTTLLGVAPTYAEMNWTGLDFSEAQFDTVTRIEVPAWRDELQLHRQHFEQLAYHLPQALNDTRAQLETLFTPAA